MAGNNIRNVVVLGHQGSGKTTLVESLYSTALGKKEKGSVEKGTTVSDYLPEEKDKLSSVRLSVVPLEYQNYKINLIDIPGNDDFIGEAIAAIGVVKGAILVLDATSGVQVETIKHWNMLRKKGIPTLIYVNKMDKESVDFEALLDEILLNEDSKAKLKERCNLQGNYLQVAMFTLAQQNVLIKTLSNDTRKKYNYKINPRILPDMQYTDKGVILQFNFELKCNMLTTQAIIKQ